MAVSMSAMTLDVMIPTLHNLNALLAKAASFAEGKKLDAGVIENSRLAADMLAFKRQVQLSSDFAKNSAARLAGIEAPRFEDTEQTLVELQSRVTRTIEFLQSIDPRSLDGAESRRIVVPLRTRTLDMDGLPFVQKWVLPNFYFHVTTAYNLLRHLGVEIGKKDFLGDV